MNPFLKFYLIGAAISFVIQIVMMLASPRVKVSMVVGYLLNTTLSWGCLLILICNGINSLLMKYHKNAVLWETKAYKEQQEKAARAAARKFPHPAKTTGRV